MYMSRYKRKCMEMEKRLVVRLAGALAWRDGASLAGLSGGSEGHEQDEEEWVFGHESG